MSEKNTIDNYYYENKKLKKRLTNFKAEKSKSTKKKKNKTFSSTNFFYQMPNQQTNKSQKRMMQKKSLPPLFNSKKLKLINLTKKESSPSNILLFNTNENDGLFQEILKIHKQVKIINKELKSLEKEYIILEKKNYTNKYFIEKILDLYDTTEENNNKDIIEGEIIKEVEENNDTERGQNKIKNSVNREKDKNKKSKNKNISDRYKKINAIKKQNNLYDITIKENENKLIKLRGKEKQKLYQELLNSIVIKNDEINEIYEKMSELNYSLFKNEKKYRFYFLHGEQYNKDKKQIDSKRNSNNKI